MLFNTLTFAVFFCIILIAYYRLQHRWQNYLLLFGSYVFYGWWDWRFLSLILISTIIDYYMGLAITRWPHRSKLFLVVSVISNLSILGFFKYCGFFIESLTDFFLLLGLHVDMPTARFILPVGISFYTFQTMSYTFDIYRGRMQPTWKFLDFALFVSFFPQLVAGPIERARKLLPQIRSLRNADSSRISEGSWLIYWGLFKKSVIADNMAVLVETVFRNPLTHTSGDVLVAVCAFAIQIYGDFSGYSDIARGVAKCLGFEIMVNFRLPYFARNPSDFWRRWHISLSSWLKDYLYVSLGGNRGSLFKTCRNLMLTMILGGLWHGAGWNFAIWGLYHGMILTIYRLLPEGSFLTRDDDSIAGSIAKGFQIFIMLVLTGIGWLIFRAENITQLSQLLNVLIGNIALPTFTLNELSMALLLVIPLLILQLFQNHKDDLMVIFRFPVLFRSLFYVCIFYMLLEKGVFGAKEFIYFQF